jgi:phosphoadenosine phosphosulfate reductase
MHEPQAKRITADGSNMNTAEVQDLNRRFDQAETTDILRWAWERFGTRAAVGTSFQGAGLVILDLCQTAGFKFPVFTLDTGLLFPETTTLRERLEAFWGIQIETLVPDMTVDDQARQFGAELWRRDPDACCTLRKVLPLRAKLAGLDGWITGLRRDQSATRDGLGVLEVYRPDAGSERTIAKLNPLAGWTREAVWAYLRRRGIPYNPLHDQGYRSIGCVPCTAKTGEGASERAGRWIGFGKTECGIHTFMKRCA